MSDHREHPLVFGPDCTPAIEVGARALTHALGTRGYLKPPPTAEGYASSPVAWMHEPFWWQVAIAGPVVAATVWSLDATPTPTTAETMATMRAAVLSLGNPTTPCTRCGRVPILEGHTDACPA